MAYPSLEQYNNAFNNHSIWLADPELKAGRVAKTGMGLPLAISGGFALTYAVTAGTKKYAVRCFHRESKALERRYTAISKRLATLRSPYFLDFQFQPKGIRIDGAEYAIVKMAWARGETLGEFLEDNHTSAQALGALASSLESLSAFLEKERIAHGDIQTGNLMVSGGGASVQLIDYDGIWVDEIKDLRSTELGHVNFQHPGRKLANPFDSTLDRFSLISLWLSIEALRADPSIWQKTKSEIDVIVFRASDFIDPSSSTAFAMVAANAALTQKAKAFAAICAAPWQKIPTLADFIAGRNTPTALTNVALTGKRAAGKPRAAYIGAYEVLRAADYDACLRHVGAKVEAIGKVVEVKFDRDRNNAPYIFVNFAPWKGRIFKIAIWSDSLKLFRTKPDHSWVGKWVSVVGLMNPTYHSEKHNYWHLSINATAMGQMAILPEEEASWRLAEPQGAAPPTREITGNRDALRKVQDSSRSNGAIASGTSFSPARPPPPVAKVSPNQAVLAAIRTSPAPQPAVRPAPSPSAPRPVPPAPAPTPAPPRQSMQAPKSRPAPRPNSVASRTPQRGLLHRLFDWLFR